MRLGRTAVFVSVAALASICLLAIGGCRPEEAAPVAPPPHGRPPDPSPGPQKTRALTLQVDFGNGRKWSTSGDAWRDGITVLDLMAWGKTRGDGLRFEQ